MLGTISVIGNAIAGWAWDPSKPYDSVTVELRSDDAIIARLNASEFRIDLVEDRIGNGKHGFSYRFVPGRLPSLPTTLRARVVELDQDLDGSIEILTIEQLERLIDPSAKITSKILGLEDGYLIGYTYNLGMPERRYSIELVSDGAVLGFGRADGFVQSLLHIGVGDGCYGFRIPVPISLFSGDNALCHLRVRDLEYELEGSPILIGMLSLPGLLSHVTRRLKNVEDELGRLSAFTPATRLMASTITEEQRLIGLFYERTEAIATNLVEKIERMHSHLFGEIEDLRRREDQK